jgi:RNA polymerase sigma-70 factor, ECF subfamily
MLTSTLDTTAAPVASPPRDDDLLRQMYADNATSLRSYVRRFTTDAEADDIVQETFIRAWRHLDQLEHDDRPLRPWLMHVARHLLADAARRRRRRPMTISDDVTKATIGIDGGIERVLDQQVLVEALRRLPAGQRAVFVEAWVFGVSLDVVAERLGIPAGTARSRMHYARRTLREHLASTKPIAS